MESHNLVIPDELFELILLKLSVRHLLRLRCVSKSWRALIDDDMFIKKHYQFQYRRLVANGDVPIFLDCIPEVRFDEPMQINILSKQAGTDLVSNRTHDFHRDVTTHLTHIDWNHDEIFNFIGCVAIVNGIVLFYWIPDCLGLWNPATREFKTITHCPVLTKDYTVVRYYGLGFDPLLNDFKIVISVPPKKPDEFPSYWMFLLRTNIWKKLQPPSPYAVAYRSIADAYLNGIHYWVAAIYNTSLQSRCILSFNFSTEVFKVLDLPHDVLCAMAEGSDVLVELYMECLAIIVCTKKPNSVYDIHVWVSNKCVDDSNAYDHDDQEGPLSWKRLFTIQTIPRLKGLLFGSFRLDGNMLIQIQTKRRREDKEGFVYDTATGTIKSLGVSCCTCFRYVESLFPMARRVSLG